MAIRLKLWRMANDGDDETVMCCWLFQSEKSQVVFGCIINSSANRTAMMKILTATILVSCILGSHGFSRANVGTRQDRVAMGRPMSVGENGLSRRSSLMSIAATWATLMQLPQPASARLEAVDRPDLLPANAGLNVIQTEKILTPGQVKRMDAMLASLEKDTGFRVRVLCQKYPNTPGLAIRDYWDLGKEVRYRQPTKQFNIVILPFSHTNTFYRDKKMISMLYWLLMILAVEVGACGYLFHRE